MALEGQLDLRAIREIEMVKAKYCAASDMFDAARGADILGQVLHEDLRADYVVKHFSSKSALTRFLTEEIKADAEWIWHSLGSPIVEVNGDRAQGDWTVTVRMRRRGAEAPIELIGRYSDQFIRQDGRWQIAAISFHSLQ